MGIESPNECKECGTEYDLEDIPVIPDTAPTHFYCSQRCKFESQLTGHRAPVSVISDGKVTIPKAIRDELELSKGDYVLIDVVKKMGSSDGF